MSVKHASAMEIGADDVAPTGWGRTAPGKVPVTARLAPRTVVLRSAAGVGTADAAGAVKNATSAGGGHALPAGLRDRFESSLGHDLDAVRVHTGAASVVAADAVGARAFAVGDDIHFADGQYRPDDPFGIHLLAHEVIHTVQQSGGAVARSLQPSLVVSSPEDGFEREAEALAPQVVRGEPVAVAGVSASVVRTVMRADAPPSGQPSGTPGWFNLQLKPKFEKDLGERKFGPFKGTAKGAVELNVKVYRVDGGDGDKTRVGGVTTSGPDAKTPSQKTSVGVAAKAGPGEAGIAVEAKHELEDSLLLGYPEFKGFGELSNKGGKAGIGVALNYKRGDWKLSPKLEFNILKWKPPADISLAVLTAAVEGTLPAFEFLAKTGERVSVEAKLSVSFDFEPDPVEIAKELLTRLGPAAVAELAAVALPLALAFVIAGGFAKSVASAEDFLMLSDMAVSSMQAWINGFDLAVKGSGTGAAAGDAGGAGGAQGAAAGSAAGNQAVAQVSAKYPEGAVVEAAKKDPVYRAQIAAAVRSRLRAWVHEEWNRRHQGIDNLWGFGGPPIAVLLSLEARLANLG